MGWARAAFEIMGTSAELLVGGVDAEGLIDLSQFRLSELEAKWSRFAYSSEVSALNRSAGRRMSVSADTATLVEVAIRGWRQTEGDFDPTILGFLLAAGYDRTFAEMADRGRRDRPRVVPFGLGCGGILVDVERSQVTLPTGVGFDPGGVGKGLAADLVAGEAIEAGAVGVCVNVGGDIRVMGPSPTGGPWIVEIPDVGAESGPHTVSLFDGAIASSSPAVRRWTDGSLDRHHLIDPHTGRSVDGDVGSVSVVASQGWQADVLTKAVFVRGAEAGLALVESVGAAALVVRTDGVERRTPSWARHTGAPG